MKYLFAGPCSAESYEQLLRTASSFKEFFYGNREGKDAFGEGGGPGGPHAMRDAGLPARVPSPAEGAPEGMSGTPVLHIRAGAWKPRTRPGCFEGYGEKALEWMEKVQDQTGQTFITEVAGARHIELCLKHRITRFWVGARTTSNPFLMEEIGQALKGCDYPVWVKNPISPDLALWVGGIERIAKHTKGLIGGIHRGFGMYECLPYRNAPLWETVVQFKRRLPGTPLLCDPSHIAGDRAYVQEVAQAAIEMEMDGFMVEVHPEPDCALSDAKQQLTLPGFADWFTALNFPKNQGCSTQIEQLRRLLDDVDDELMQILARRMDLVRQLGHLKKVENLSVLQFDRWNRVMERCLEIARQKDLDEAFVKKLMHCLHEEAVRVQKGI